MPTPSSTRSARAFAPRVPMRGHLGPALRGPVQAPVLAGLMERGGEWRRPLTPGRRPTDSTEGGSPPPARRRRWPWVLLGFSLIVLIALGVVVAWEMRTSQLQARYLARAGCHGAAEADAFLGPVRSAIIEAGSDLDETFSTGGGIYSDHQPFMMRGIPILTVRSQQRPEAGGVGHTIHDIRDVIDEPGIARTAAVSAALLWAAANAPELGMPRWSEAEIGSALEDLGVRDPLERAGEWRWP
jgi:hypothetical protein